MRAARWSPVVLAVLFLAGCGQATHASALHLTAKDRNKNFALKSNQALVVTLPANRSSGYRWIIAAPPVPPGVTVGAARVVSHRYIRPTYAAPGAEGKEIWRFR